MKKCVNWLMALLLFGMLAYPFVNWEKEQNRQRQLSADLVILGDSIFANQLDDKSIGSQLQSRLKIKVLDCSLGGTSMAYTDRDDRPGNLRDYIGMLGLTKAICSGDFRLQQAIDVRENATSYFGERLALLQQIDFSNVKVLLIDHLINDFHAGVPILPEEGVADSAHSYAGALRMVLTMLQEKYPDLQIVILSPPFLWYPDQGCTSYDQDFGQGPITEYMAVEEEVASELGITYLSIFDVYGWENYDDWQIYTVDGIHPSEIGLSIIDDYLEKELKDIFQE